MAKTDIDALIGDYLHRLDVALSPLPSARRQQLVAEISEHLDEARSHLPSQSETAIRDLLDRVGQPEEIAAEAMADQPNRDCRRPSRRLLMALIGLIAILALGAGLALFLLGGNRRALSTTPPPTAATVAAVTVPWVLGTTSSVAEHELQALDLRWRIVEKYDKTAPTGLVVAEAPALGTKVAVGSIVTLVVSARP